MTTPPGYRCNVCSQTDHFRVNCPVIRSAGFQHVFGKRRARKFKESQKDAEREHEATIAMQAMRCDESAEVEAAAVSVAEPAASKAWQASELDLFPMRESCLQPNVLVSDLSAGLQQRLWAFVSKMVMPHNPEVGRAFAACARALPTALRVKELIESIEAYAVLEAFVVTSCSQAGRSCRTIADLACGHGLVGLLLAYRFPHREVICCDLKRRPAFDALVDAFRSEGSKLDAWEEPLQNLSFLEGTLDCEAVRSRLGPKSYVVALHACTEANSTVIEMARDAGALWAVMPCCMRSTACFPDGCQLVRCPDDTRYALLCGSLAERYQAELVVSIDKRITNRHVVMCGGAAKEDGGHSRGLRPLLYHMPGKSEVPRYADYYNVKANGHKAAPLIGA
mmetsp:Transcript_31067/g.99355  ORF Transcript_31067/g.99355 Transcript_31067/m.99355 type:complete len:394 (-) Transcript_31067:163-1344(-)